MKKFTQEELVEAYEQMVAERNEDFHDAREAAKWFQEQLGFGTVHAFAPRYGYGTSPVRETYYLKLIHETYGPYQNDYEVRLQALPCVTATKPKVFGVTDRQGETIYEVDMPHGKYEVVFEYFDNHCTGY